MIFALPLPSGSRRPVNSICAHSISIDITIFCISCQWTSQARASACARFNRANFQCFRLISLESRLCCVSCIAPRRRRPSTLLHSAHKKKCGGKMTKKIGWGQAMVQKHGKRVQKATYNKKKIPLPNRMNKMNEHSKQQCWWWLLWHLWMPAKQQQQKHILHLVSFEKAFSAWLHLLNWSSVRRCNNRSGVHSKWKIVLGNNELSAASNKCHRQNQCDKD